MSVFDYNKTEFDTVEDMCECYEIDVNVYKRRISLGWSVEDALEVAVSEDEYNTAQQDKRKDNKDSILVGLNGEHFSSETELCNYYGIIPELYSLGKSLGWGLNRLVAEAKENNRVLISSPFSSENTIETDNFDIYYDDALQGSNLHKLSKENGVSCSALKQRLESGMSVTEALQSAQHPIIKDHLGNQYKTVKDMCATWGIPVQTYLSRLKNNYSLENALTLPHHTNDGCRYGDIRTMPIRKLCRDNNMLVRLFNYRSRHGFTLSECLNPSCIDHLGNKFVSWKEMCKYHNIPRSTFESRLDADLSWEEVLSGRNSKKVVDHTGREFESIESMCEHYGVSVPTYYARLRKGLSLEDTLTWSVAPYGGVPIEDHLGNKFSSVKAMCRHYGIKPSTYRARINKGMSVEDALKLEDMNKISVKDHLGNEFSSINDMCRHYGIGASTYRKRIKKGMSLEDALTSEFITPKFSRSVSDHLGNEFDSISDMCKHYGVNYFTYIGRINRGMSVADALELEDKRKTSVKDHLGNEFDSISDMCKHYGINTSTYRARMEKGIPLKEVLGVSDNDNAEIDSTKEPSVTSSEQVKDHRGVEFRSIDTMCLYYGISRDIYERRRALGWSLRKTLTLKRVLPPTDISGAVVDHKGIKYKSISAMCKAYSLAVRDYKWRLSLGWSLDEILETNLTREVDE